MTRRTAAEISSDTLILIDNTLSSHNYKETASCQKNILKKKFWNRNNIMSPLHRPLTCHYLTDQ